VGSITLDGKVLDNTYQEESVLEVVAAVEKDLVEEGTIIVEVTVDGKNLLDFLSVEGELVPFSADSDIVILTRKLNEILMESLDQFVTYLQRLIPGVGQIAEQYRLKEYHEANTMYTEAIDGIRVMIEMLQGMFQSKSLDFSAPDFDGKSLLDMMEVLKVVIQKLVEAQTNDNYEEMAVLLDKELAPTLGSWLLVLPIVRGQMVEM
jgi:hypothetical protein